MAFIADASKEEEKKEQGGMDVISSGQGASIDGAAAPAAGASKGGSGSFTNIQDYVAANKPKTSQLAEGITGQVKEEGQKLRSGLGEQRESYLGQQGKFGEGQKQFIQKQISGAGQQEQSQGDLDRFTKLRQASEQGPDLTKQRQQATDLERRAKQYETSKGRFEGLQKLVGGQAATYGKGQRQLDQLLLAGDRQAKQKSIKDIRQATRGLGEQVGTLESDIGTARTGLQEQARTGVADARTTAQEAARGKYERLQSGVAAGELGEQGLTDLGIEAGQRTYGTDVAGMLDRSRGMSSQEAARLDQLAKMSGLEGRDIFQQAVGTDLSGDIQQQIAQRKGEYETALDPYVGSYTRGGFGGVPLEQGTMTRERMMEGIIAARDQIRDTGIYSGENNDKTRAVTRLGEMGRLRPAGLGIDTETIQQEAQKMEELKRQYAGQFGLTPQVKDGGVIKDPKILALKKMRGY